MIGSTTECGRAAWPPLPLIASVKRDADAAGVDATLPDVEPDVARHDDDVTPVVEAGDPE